MAHGAVAASGMPTEAIFVPLSPALKVVFSAATLVAPFSYFTVDKYGYI